MCSPEYYDCIPAARSNIGCLEVRKGLAMKTALLKNIRILLVMPFVVSIGIILVVIIWAMDRQQQAEISTLGLSYDSQLSKSFVDALMVEAKYLEGFIYLFRQNAELAPVFTEQNREALQQQVLPVYSHLNDRHNVTHFYFIQPAGQVFLRVHRPKQYGDIIRRKTFLQAYDSKQPAAGIELGVSGELVLRVVFPWKVKGKVIGYIELGKEIDHVFDGLAANNNVGLVFSLDPDYIQKNKLIEKGFLKLKKMQGDAGGDQFIVYSSMASVTLELQEFIREYSRMGARYLKQDNRSFFVSQVPIVDFGGVLVGRLAYTLDETALVKQRRYIVFELALLVFVFASVICVFYIVYSTFLRRYLGDVFGRLEDEIHERKQIEKSLVDNKAQLELVVRERSESLGESRRRYKVLFDKSADAILLIEGNKYVDCNQAALDMMGYASKDAFCLAHPSTLSPRRQPDGQLSREKANHLIETAFKHGSHRFEWTHMRKSGEVFPVEALLTAIPYKDKQWLHVVIRDITDRKKAEEEIEFKAFYDALTNLPNRRLLFDRLAQSLVDARQYKYFNALLYLDIDRFKAINDTLGHSVGDALLVVLAERIQSSLTYEDTASRFSGDEFVILLRHVGENRELASFQSEKICSQILKALSVPIIIEKHEFNVTASIGIAVFPNQEDSADDIVKHADTAMCSAKELGRNRIAFFLTDMHEKVMYRLNLERDLHKTVKENKLEVYYQPQMNLLGHVVAVEALVRWQREGYGFVSPEEFIPIAEESGIIFELGDFVLKRSISDIVGLNEKLQLHIGLAVNISQKQFDKDGFLADIQSLIENFQLQRNMLTLEVTEGLAINDLNATVERFDALRHLGVRLSLDDFGTGYSSLSHLKRLPLDELKIDKSFVFDIHNDPQDAQLVKTIVSIAHQFGLAAVAEGVEGEKELAFLEALNCDIIQGYYYSRPIPIAELEIYLKERMENPDTRK